jgi:hypothetical protein
MAITVRNYGLENQHRQRRPPLSAVTAPEVANQPSWILFRLFVEYFKLARHKR